MIKVSGPVGAGVNFISSLLTEEYCYCPDTNEYLINIEEGELSFLLRENTSFVERTLYHDNIKWNHNMDRKKTKNDYSIPTYDRECRFFAFTMWFVKRILNSDFYVPSWFVGHYFPNNRFIDMDNIKEQMLEIRKIYNVTNLVTPFFLNYLLLHDKIEEEKMNHFLIKSYINFYYFYYQNVDKYDYTSDNEIPYSSIMGKTELPNTMKVYKEKIMEYNKRNIDLLKTTEKDFKVNFKEIFNKHIRINHD